MEIRSALLNSAVTLNNLMPGQASKPEIARALAAIDRMGKRGDTEVLASIYGQNRVTWGGTSKPLDQQFQHFIQKAAPEAQAGREAVSKALEGLELATETFVTSAEAWREPEAAARGYQQLEEYDLAEQALKEALSRQL